jgi:hypothetical protein
VVHYSNGKISYSYPLDKKKSIFLVEDPNNANVTLAGQHLWNINMSCGNNQHAWGNYHISPDKIATHLRSTILEFDGRLINFLMGESTQ